MVTGNRQHSGANSSAQVREPIFMAGYGCVAAVELRMILVGLFATRACAKGNLSVNVVPLPTAESTRNRP